jgi:putative DNA primase/helicase
MMKTKTTDWAHGRWPSILGWLAGIKEDVLSGRRVACPICGGDDRFKFDNKEGRGTYYCNQCGAGDGMHLLTKVKGWTFHEAANEIDKLHAMQPNIRAAFSKANGDTIEARRAKLNALWDRGKSPEMLKKYLVQQRGFNLDDISLLPFLWDLRGVEALPLYDGGVLLGKYPAMLAMVRNPQGRSVSLHRTWMTDDNTTRVKKLMPGIENWLGGAIRLAPAGEHMVVGEGIETTLAGMELLGLPGWAAISADGLKAIKFPKEVRELTILADNDSSFTGQAAAFERARIAAKDGLSVTVQMAGKVGEDMYDVWLQMKRTGQAGSSWSTHAAQ